MGFPLANLKQLYGDARAVKRFTEEILLGLAHACAVLGVRSVETRSDLPGLWTNRGKIASLGLTVKDGFVFHGFSLNVYHSSLSGFGLIHPCGIPNLPLTSLEQEGVRVDSIKELAMKILPYLTVVSGDEVMRSSKTVSYENNYSQLVATVSRSQMAIDHYRANLENNQNRD